jgi:hypothetical protein
MMNSIAFVDQVPLKGARITADGYLVAEVRCARVGCQDYLADEIGVPGGGFVSLYRPETAVFHKDSLATFAGKPVTMGHPPVNVNADNWKEYAVGDIGNEIARDGEFVRVPIKLMDAAAIRAVQDGTREISMGYTTDIQVVDGVAPDGTVYRAVQSGPIRINHLAIVPVARGGSQLRVGDAAESASWGASPITDRKDVNMADAVKTRMVLVDGLSVETTDAGAQAIEKLQRTIDAQAAEFKKKAEEAEVEGEKKMAAKDAAMATKDAQLDAMAAKVVDAAALDKLVADRAELIGRAKAIAPAVVTDGQSASEIKKAVVVAVRGADAASKSEAYIDAAFDLLQDAKADPLKGAKLADAPGGLEEAYRDRDQRLNDAWKTQPVKKEA